VDLQSLLEELSKKQSPRLDLRKKRLQGLDLIRNRQYYKILGLPEFDKRYTPGMTTTRNKYLPIDKRRSAASYDLPAIIVRDLNAQQCGKGKFPVVTLSTPEATMAFAEYIRLANLEAVMDYAADEASIGSCVIVPEAVTPDGDNDSPTLHFSYWKAFEVDVVFERNAPNTIAKVTRTWEVSRSALQSDGYDVKELDKKWAAKALALRASRRKTLASDRKPEEYQDWIMRRVLDKETSTWYEPVPKKIYESKDWDDLTKDGVEPFTTDDARTINHGLGFCPAIFHIPCKGDAANFPDGRCIFEGSVDNKLAIDKVMSIGVQAVVMAGTPQLAVSKSGAGSGADEIEGPNPSDEGFDPEDVIEVEEKGGAWLVQLDGGALTPLDIVLRRLRDMGLENEGGSRITEESLAGAKSGYAMELLNQALTYVAGKMRPYFAATLVRVVRMLAAMRTKWNGLACEEGDLPDFDLKAKVKQVSFGPFYQMTGQDKQAEVAAVVALVQGGLMTAESAITYIAQFFDITDVEDEISKVKTQTEAAAQTEHDRAVELKQTAPPKENAA
jgi:hypothetical protein